MCWKAVGRLGSFLGREEGVGGLWAPLHEVPHVVHFDDVSLVQPTFTAASAVKRWMKGRVKKGLCGLQHEREGFREGGEVLLMARDHQ